MRHVAGLFLGLILATGSMPAAAQESLALARAECAAGDGTVPETAEVRQRMITACTSIIRSGRVPPQMLAAAYNNRGAARLAEGDQRGARADVEEALFLAPNLAAARFNRALLLAAAGATEQALADRNTAARQIPGIATLPLAPDTPGRVVDLPALGPAAAIPGAMPRPAPTPPPEKDAEAKPADDSARQRAALRGLATPPPPRGDDMAAAADLFSRAVQRARAGDSAGALAAYTEALARDPTFSMAWNNRGILRARLGDREGALADFEEAVRTDQRNARALNNRGLLRLELGQAEPAVQDFTAAIRLDPEFALAFTNRGLGRTALGDTAGAMADFDRAIRLDPRAARAYAGRGALKARLGDEPGSRADLATAGRIDPAAVASSVGVPK